MTERRKYKKAFKIACELLNGDILYGYDSDCIFAEMMKKDGVVSSLSYAEFILNNLDRLTGKSATRQKVRENTLHIENDNISIQVVESEDSE